MYTILIRRLLAAALALVLVAGGTIAAEARQWTLADTATGPFLADVQIAPDGRSALLAIVRGDLKHNAFQPAYDSVNLQTGRLAPMPATLAHARWAPDSRSIAWIDGSGRHSRIVITNAAGKNVRPVSDGKRDVVAFSWSRDGKSIAATELQPAQNSSRLLWLSLEGDYHDTAPARRSMYLINPATHMERELTHDGWSYGGAAGDADASWSPDNTQIVAVRQPSSQYGDFEHEQYVRIGVRSGVVAQVSESRFFAYPGSAAPIFGPAGSHVAYTHTWDGLLPSREDLYVDGRDVTAPLDRDLWSCGGGAVAWSGTDLIASMMDGVSFRMYRIDPSAQSAPQALTATDGSVGGFSVARTGRIAYLWSTPTQPSELYVIDPGGKPRRITHVNSLPAGLAVAQTQLVEWSDGAGHQLHGQLTLPAQAASSRVPLVVEPHGGPQCADDYSFAPQAQYVASLGYAYFRPDPPGSDGYGDWSYKAIVGSWGEKPMAADLDGIKALDARNIADPSKTFIEGGSYGGYLTSWIATHDTTTFKAAVAQVPVTDMLMEYTLSESPNILRRFFGERPATNQQLLVAESPVTYSANARTPLLVIAGLADTRAPYMQAIEFYKTLAEDGAPVKMLVDPKAGHGPDDPQGGVEWLRATLGWFAEHGGISSPELRLPK